MPKAPTFFLDRTFGSEKLADDLRNWNWRVEVHRRWFKHRADDPVWIETVAEKRWCIVTADQDVESRYHEEISRTKAGIFVLGSLKNGEDYRGWLRMMARCKNRIVHDWHFAPHPFVARITTDGNLHLINHILAHGRVRDVTKSLEANSKLYLMTETGQV